MPKRLSALVAMTAMSTMLLFTGGSAIAAPPAPSLTIPFEETSSGGSVVGTFDLERFAVQGGQLVAIGEVTAEVLNTAGEMIGTVTDLAVTLPVLDTNATCDILELTLGPLDLDLLGLQVHLDEVHLVIEAQPGPGNLLGNLLCAIAGLLDTNAGLNTIARLLNQLLGLLG